MKMYIMNILIFIFIAVLALLVLFRRDIFRHRPTEDEMTMTIVIISPSEIYLNGEAITTKRLCDRLKDERGKYGECFPILRVPKYMDLQEVAGIIDSLCETMICKYRFQSGKKIFGVSLPCPCPKVGVSVIMLKNHKYVIADRISRTLTIFDETEFAKKMKIMYGENFYLYIGFEKGCTYQDFIDMAEIAVPIGYRLQLDSYCDDMAGIIRFYDKPKGQKD